MSATVGQARSSAAEWVTSSRRLWTKIKRPSFSLSLLPHGHDQKSPIRPQPRSSVWGSHQVRRNLLIARAPHSYFKMGGGRDGPAVAAAFCDLSRPSVLPKKVNRNCKSPFWLSSTHTDLFSMEQIIRSIACVFVCLQVIRPFAAHARVCVCAKFRYLAVDDHPTQAEWESLGKPTYWRGRKANMMEGDSSTMSMCWPHIIRDNFLATTRTHGQIRQHETEILPHRY